MNTHDVGACGENIAAAYLQSLGYRILERNVRFGRYEIDIVAYDPIDGGMRVFVEVKTRATHTRDYPIHTALNPRKRSAMRSAVGCYLSQRNYSGPGRTDLVSVEGTRIVEHLKAVGSDFF